MPEGRRAVRMKKPPIRALCCNFGFGGFGLGLNTLGTDFDALAVHHGILEVGEQAADRGAHTVGAFYGAGIGLTAHGTHSWHKWELKINR